MTGDELRNIRWRLGDTQKEFAKRLFFRGKHAWATISRYENGHQPIPPRVETLINMLSEPVGAPHSEKWTLTGPAQPPE